MDIPFSQSKKDFNELLNLSKGTIDYFDITKNSMMANEYSLFLSNGDIINFVFNENNVPHLLGFKNLDKLTDLKLYDSYNVLKSLVYNIDLRKKCIEKIEKFNEPYEKYISKHWRSKIKNIELQTKAPYPNEVMFVCKFNREINFGNGGIDRYKDCDYYIGRETKNGDILLLGLIKNKYGSYSPMTTRLFEKDSKDEELKELLQNQTLCYVQGLIVKNNITDYNYKTNLRMNEKIEVLQKLKKISSKTNSPIDCSKDYIYDLEKMEQNCRDLFYLKNIITKMNDYLDKKVIMCLNDEEQNLTLSINKKIQELILRINDLIMQNSNNDKNKVSYFSIVKENEKLKRKLEMVMSNFEKANIRVKELEDENKKAKNEAVEDYFKRNKGKKLKKKRK